MSFNITTEDGIYNYTNNGVFSDQYTNQEKFSSNNNNKTANTQGYLIKVQKGNERLSCKVQMADLLSNIEDNLYPILTHASTCNVTFNRAIPFRGTTLGKFEMIDFKVLNEWTAQGRNGADCIEVEISLVEVIPV
jgi:hypothetical protein